MEPAEDGGERALARPVLTEDGVDLAAPDVEVHTIVGDDAGEPLDDPPGRQHRTLYVRHDLEADGAREAPATSASRAARSAATQSEANVTTWECPR